MKLNFNKTILIAEIGWNFLGNLSLAKRMIREAKKSGADAVKFQLWNPKNLKSGSWDYDGRRELYNKSFLSYDKFKHLYKFSQKIKIECFASVFSKQDLNIHKKINKRIIKIPSSEAYDINLIKLALRNFSKVIVSTGTLKKKELLKLCNFKNNKLILLHCVSSYPLNDKDINFGKFFYLKKKFKNVGYSGHSPNIYDALWAIANNANVVEKHFTINNSLKGRDNKFSILPKDFRKISLFRNFSSSATQKNTLDLQKCEIDVYKNYRGRWRIND
tara:strand:- start:240 stop:1061 length:822 start_codon:yes stop_codon:yes gene_type:complete